MSEKELQNMQVSLVFFLSKKFVPKREKVETKISELPPL